jgi:hypothetical protein
MLPLEAIGNFVTACLNGVIQVAGFDQDESEQLFRRLGEWPVGDEPLAVSNPHGLRGLDALEGRRDEVVTALAEHVVVGEGLVDQTLHFALGQSIQRRRVDEAQVLHDTPFRE